MDVSMNVRQPRSATSVVYADVAVVGAGPYGLSTAAHLRERGLSVVIFGKPLQLWREHMPEGMLLRSFWWATNLSDPRGQYSLARYFRLHNLEALYPLPIEMFIDYALWFQRQVVPDVDETYVTSIERQKEYFELLLDDGRKVRCRSVVMAPGLYYYSYRPEEYRYLPAELVSHTSEHRSVKRFAGKRVIVIGGGQSALESAALLNESGAQVTVVARNAIHWLNEQPVEGRTLYQRLRSPKAGIAPGWFNWCLENAPYVFQGLSRKTKDQLLSGRGSYGPAGSSWLKPRIIGAVALHEEQAVKEVKETGKGLDLTLFNKKVLHADHLLLATGYRMDVAKLPMLSPDLITSIETYQNAPVLNQRFESSVPDLYFIGFSSVISCGPLYRFVVGTRAAARRVADAVARQVAPVYR